jgi:hypothetical protein
VKCGAYFSGMVKIIAFPSGAQALRTGSGARDLTLNKIERFKTVSLGFYLFLLAV